MWARLNGIHDFEEHPASTSEKIPQRLDSIAPSCQRYPVDNECIGARHNLLRRRYWPREGSKDVFSPLWQGTIPRSRRRGASQATFWHSAQVGTICVGGSSRPDKPKCFEMQLPDEEERREMLRRVDERLQFSKSVNSTHEKIRTLAKAN